MKYNNQYIRDGGTLEAESDFTLWWGSIFRRRGGIMLTASCRLMFPCKAKICALYIMLTFSSIMRLQVPHVPFTHRLSLADQELVELLQQGRFSNNLPAHVGVPGLLIRIPRGDGARLKDNF